MLLKQHRREPGLAAQDDVTFADVVELVDTHA